MFGNIIIDTVLTIILALGVILLIWTFVEPHILTVRREVLPPVDGNGGNGGNGGNECAAGTGVPRGSARIFFFSDLHAEFCFISPARLIAVIEKEHKARPLDAVVFGGDIINNPLKHEKGKDYLSKAAEALKRLGIPFYGVTGNHDVMIPASELEGYDIRWLHGGCTILESKDGNIPFALAGVRDSGRECRVWYDVPALPEGQAVSRKILIAHNPDVVLHMKDTDTCDYIISGHIHRGQIRTPFGIEFTVLRKDDLPRQKVITGTHIINGKCLHISDGIGCVRLPMRFLCLPQVSVLDIPL